MISFTVPPGWTLGQVLTALSQACGTEIDLTDYTEDELGTVLPTFKVENSTLEDALALIRKDYL